VSRKVYVLILTRVMADLLITLGLVIVYFIPLDNKPRGGQLLENFSYILGLGNLV